MNNTYLIYAYDAGTTKAKPIYLEKICFKPLIEYCIETLTILSGEKPYIVTNDLQKLSKYNSVANIVENVNDIQCTRDIIVVSAASPLITENVIKYGFEQMKLSRNNAAKVGEGLFAINSRYINILKELFEKSNFKCNEGISIYEDFSNETMICKNKMDLAYADKQMRLYINKRLMENDVCSIDPENTYIQKDVIIGKYSVVYPNTIIEGKTQIGNECEIHPGCHINNSIIGDNVVIEYSNVNSSIIGDFVNIGPFAYVRPGSNIGNNAKIGDFVELKKATVGDDTKISHLTYIGDAIVGKAVNVGCGTVTVNYDGKSKHVTEIGDEAFIGCNTNLVAPVNIGKGAFVAAGSTITDNVPDKCMAIARSRQVNKDNWVLPKDRN